MPPKLAKVVHPSAPDGLAGRPPSTKTASTSTAGHATLRDRVSTPFSAHCTGGWGDITTSCKVRRPSTSLGDGGNRRSEVFASWSGRPFISSGASDGLTQPRDGRRRPHRRRHSDELRSTRYVVATNYGAAHRHGRNKLYRLTRGLQPGAAGRRGFTSAKPINRRVALEYAATGCHLWRSRTVAQQHLPPVSVLVAHRRSSSQGPAR